MTRSTLPLILAALSVGCGAPGAAQPDRPQAEVSLGVTDMDGRAHDLDAALARGETVALIFWQTWCGSCKAEAPAIARAVATHGERIRFVGVVPGAAETVDDGEVREAIASWGYDTFPHVRDRDMSLTQAVGVRGTPTVVVLSGAREVRYRAHRPPSDWTALHGEPVVAAAEAPSTPSGESECVDGVCPLPSEAKTP